MDKLDRSRRVIRRQITNIKDSLDQWSKMDNPENVCGRVEAAVEDLNSLKAQYVEVFEESMDLIDYTDDKKGKAAEDLLCKDQLDINGLIYLCLGKAKEITTKPESRNSRESLLNTSNGEYSHQHSGPKLPKIEIKKFDGDCRHFPEFKGLFKNLVHDNISLSQVQKLYYLKESMVGHAADDVRDIPLTEDGYTEAWDRVLAKYDKVRLIIHAHLHDLFSIEKIKSESETQSLLDKTDRAIRGLKICGEKTDEWSTILTYLLSQKLDFKTLRDWNHTITNNSKYPTFDSLKEFLSTRTSLPLAGSPPDDTKPKQRADQKRSFAVTKPTKCYACNATHLLITCPAFLAKTPAERYELVKHNRLCVNCFGNNHASKECRSTSCKKCNKRHNTLLHFESSIKEPSSDAVSRTINWRNRSSDNQSTTLTSSNLASASARKVVLLPSALVKFACGAISGTIRILLDSCSQPTLISDEFIRRLRLQTFKLPDSAAVKGVGGDVVSTTRACSLALSSLFGGFSIDVTADIVPASSLTYGLSNVPIGDYHSELMKFNLADSALCHSNINIPRIDLLLGAEYFEKCMLNHSKILGSIFLRNTHFGWTVSGPINNNVSYCSSFCASSMQYSFNTVQDVQEQLRSFWDIEDVSSPESSTSEQKQCDQHFESTYQRLDDGRFVIRLPFKMDKSKVSNNRNRALACLIRGEKTSNQELREKYVKFMQEYLDLDHMEYVPAISSNTPTYFLPHHGILRPSSTTTKLRVVFNASSKPPQGVSLNDALMNGPVLQPDLIDILIRFRSFAFAFSADVEKMYRCVLVHEEDRDMQRIVWRDDHHNTAHEVQLKTVTYGTKPAAYLATKVLQILAKEIADVNPVAAQMISEQFYMDDLLAGSDTTDGVALLQQAIHSCLLGAGYRLRKYMSNSPELLSTLPPELIESSPELNLSTTGPISILGLAWKPKDDVLMVKIGEYKLPAVITKRVILAEIAKTFDPLGILAPVTIAGKLLLQDVWKEQLAWDDPVSDVLSSTFLEYIANLRLLRSFDIRRHYTPRAFSQLQLVGFCDASVRAYSAVVYLRAGQSSYFVCAKTKVAPIKQLSIPRLELQAAVLLVDILHRVQKVLGIKEESTFAYSDSMVVLSWLAKQPDNWTLFVANRVAKIQNKVPFNKWCYVPTKENPADLATRGVSPSKFLSCEVWLTGPKFLENAISPSPTRVEETSMELRKLKQVACNVVAVDLSLIEKFSSYQRLIRVTAYVTRFGRFCRSTMKLRSRRIRTDPQYLTTEEMNDATNRIYCLAQLSAYSQEYTSLSEGRPIPARSCLSALNPFLDNNKVLRSSTRLTNAPVSFDRKNPIVLPAKSHLATLLVRHVHRKYFHATKAFVCTFLRFRYHFTGGITNVVKAEIRRCVICLRYKAETGVQLMGSLPVDRCTVSRPFTTTGVDFAGPFTCRPMIKRSKVRLKVYAAVFICFATRAVHLEVVSALSTEEFLNSLHRFVSRRGLPGVIYSDNGTNFHGAARYLDLHDHKLQGFCAAEGIQWRFNPPRAPHRGGLWEAAVKSMKYHMVRVTMDQTLNLEEYATLFCRIEAILNSRPLCYTPDGSAPAVLTAGHFLIGNQITSLPEPETTSVKLSLRYKLVNQQILSFWNVWSKDYLSQLKTRSKWRKAKPNVTIGQIVILKDELLKPAYWSMGRINAVYPDSDGLVRTVEVVVNGSSKRRAITSIVPLPVDKPADQS